MSYLPIASEGLIAFDIGGTWFRAALVTSDGKLSATVRTPAVSFRACPDLTEKDLQGALVRYLVTESWRVREESGRRPTKVAISMGAALDGRNGMLWSSGPLWGPSTGPFDLAAALRQADDSFEWLVFNDITAALMWHVIRDDRSTTRTLLVTVSSGIGARLWDGVRRRIPLDPECGLQGEIGHLPISFMMDGKIIERDCDCGGKNHLNAFCSGSAIPSLLAAAVDRATPKLLSSSPLANAVNPGFTELAAAVKSEDEFALSLVSHLTRPLADLLLCQLTFDPEIERIIITGGVVHGLGHNYFESVLAHLDRIGLYEVSARAPAFFRERLELGLADDSAGLMGAAIMAASYSYGEQQI